MILALELQCVDNVTPPPPSHLSHPLSENDYIAVPPPNGKWHCRLCKRFSPFFYPGRVYDGQVCQYYAIN